MRKWWLLLVALVLWNLLGYALAISRSTDSPNAASGTPDATRIVSGAPNLTEILYALGLGEAVVGVTIGSNSPPLPSTSRR